MKLYAILLTTAVLVLTSCNLQDNPAALTENEQLSKDKDKSNELMTSTMNVAPYRIVLNAKGNFDDIQCSFPGAMPSGYSIHSFDLELYFNDNLVAEAESFTYCYTDNIYFAGFDRTDLQNNSYVQSLSEGNVDAEMKGSYTLSNSDDETLSYTISKYDVVYIKKPGK